MLGTRPKTVDTYRGMEVQEWVGRYFLVGVQGVSFGSLRAAKKWVDDHYCPGCDTVAMCDCHDEAAAQGVSLDTYLFRLTHPAPA
jgi:hypothetical protein